MALDNYSNLKQSMKLWSHREDVVGEIANDCVTMAEQEIFHGASPIRAVEMLSEQIDTVSTKKFPYPDDMLEVVAMSIEVEGIYYRLENIPIQHIRDDTNEKSCPSKYAMTDQFVLDVEPDKDYNIKIEYYQKPNSLSDDNPTNIILTKYPDVYLMGCVAKAMQWAGEEDRMNEYVVRMRDEIARVNADSDNLRYGGTPTAFIDGYTP